MAGVKGRSGGARPNTGGARHGAGRKPKPIVHVDDKPASSGGDDPLKLLMDIAFGRIEVSPLQVRAAVAAVQYTHAKVGEGGKKERKQAEAHKVVSKFQPGVAPKLVAVK